MSPPSGSGYSFRAAPGTPGSGLLKFNMTSDCRASSHFIGSHLINDVESTMTELVELDPPATIIVVDYGTHNGVSMGTLTVRTKDEHGVAHSILLLAMNVSRLGRHLFLGGTAALRVSARSSLSDRT